MNEYRTITELNCSSEGLDTPPGMYGIVLYPHQRTSVAALLSIENKRLTMLSKYNFTGFRQVNTQGTNIYATSSAAVLSDRLGSGKTFIALAMMLYRPIPPAYPMHINTILLDDTIMGTARAAAPFHHEITRRFVSPTALIRANLIVVGGSVLAQWRSAISNHTCLQAIIVHDRTTLLHFRDLYITGRLPMYDVVLLKNCTVMWEWQDKKDRVICHILAVVMNITESGCWSRVFYDDFDTVLSNHKHIVVPALFSVYISSTATYTPVFAKDTPLVTYKSIIEALGVQRTPIAGALNDHTLLTVFNVRNTAQFTDDSLSIPVISSWRYMYVSESDNYTRLMSSIQDDDIGSIVDMVNGEAISTAADVLGIASRSVADIFERVLDNQYARHLHDKRVLDAIDDLNTSLAGLEYGSAQYYTHEHEPSIATLDDVRHALCNEYSLPRGYNIVRSRALDDMLAALHREYTAAHEKDGCAINRVISNIKEGICQVCRLELKSLHVFIVKCCGITVCDECGIKGNRVRRRYDEQTRTFAWYGRCANCMRHVYPARDLIFIDKKFNIETLISARGDEDDTISEPEYKVSARVICPKTQAVLDIIATGHAQGGEVVTRQLPGVIEGRVNKPHGDNIARKVIVFASYNETLEAISTVLSAHQVSYVWLSDGASAIERFRNDTTVLFISSQTEVAGLNLEFITDIIYYHRAPTSTIEAQIVGRGQRIGRTVDLHIHYLRYTFESD